VNLSARMARVLGKGGKPRLVPFHASAAAAIRAVGPGDVQRVAQQYIHPDHLTIVIVGDRKTVEPSVRALNLGPIKQMSIDDVFAPAR